MSDPHRIVAEFSKTWMNGTSNTPALISQQFEAVIEQNRKRSYELESWNISQVWVPDKLTMVETIIAVFVRTL